MRTESKIKKKKKQLAEELCCPVCLEIFFEPCTTACGHSYCKKCLDFAAVNCGNKCPNCRQVISYDGTLNIVLWNITQLWFPQEVEARKAAGVLNNREIASPSQSPTGGSDDADQYIEVSSSGSVSRYSRDDGLQSDIYDTAGRNLVALVIVLREQWDLHHASVENFASTLASFRAQLNLRRATISASLNSHVSARFHQFKANMDTLNYKANSFSLPSRLVAQFYCFSILRIGGFMCLVYPWLLDLSSRRRMNS